MKKQSLLIKSVLGLLCLCIISCSNENIPENKAASLDSGATKIVIQQRNPLLTHKLREDMPLTRGYQDDDAKLAEYPYNYLGYTYKVGNGIIADEANIGFPIFNSEEIVKDTDTKGYLNMYPIKEPDTNISTFSTYDRYEQKTNIKKKVESGFSLNLKLFKIGNKTKYEQTFAKDITSESKYIMGEVNLYYRATRVTLNPLPYFSNEIAANYLRKSFIKALYNSSINEIVEYYGPFVIANYYTGGRAVALSISNYKSNSLAETLEKDFSNALSLGIQWSKKTDNPNNSLNNTLDYTSFNKNETQDNQNFTNTKIQIHTMGGEPAYAVSTPSGDITGVKIDLTDWFKSLSNEKNNRLIDFVDEGLLGLDRFVLEENFKQRIRKTHLGTLSEKGLVEPSISIGLVQHPRDNSWPIGFTMGFCPTLITRNGDRIVFANEETKIKSYAEWNEYAKDFNKFLQIGKQYAERFGKYFQCEINIVKNGVLLTEDEDVDSSVNIFIPTTLDDASFSKYTNPATNITYVYDKKSKIAFSYYNNGLIPDMYGIEKWIESIPENNISMDLLYTRYKIIGL